MTTRLELRTALRHRLEDLGTAPLWDDPTLNEFLTGASRRYGAMFPRELATTVSVEVGVMSVPVPSVVIEGTRIIRVLDDAGALVPRARDDPNEPDSAAGGILLGQAWQWWDGTLLLQRPAPRTGSWRIEHLGSRELPSDDVTQADLIPGDEEIVVALAAATALRRRAVEDGKRGSAGSSITREADAAERDAERLAGKRRRRTRGGWLAPG